MQSLCPVCMCGVTSSFGVVDMTFKVVELALGTADRTVARLVLARPKKKNAINLAMYSELQAALEAVSECEHTKSVVLSADGDYYSSGNDLANFSQLQHPKTMAKNAKGVCYTFVDSFISCKKPIVVAVNGPAIGIAVTTMGLCDARIAVDRATFHTPFRALGQAPEGCSSLMFERLMGKEVAHRMLEEGATLSAADAKACGFVDEIVPQDQLVERATAVALERGARGKRWFDDEPGLEHELRRVNQREVDVLEEAWVSEECFTALDEYLSSRKQTVPALVLRTLNRTRFLWDR